MSVAIDFEKTLLELLKNVERDQVRRKPTSLVGLEPRIMPFLELPYH